MVLGLLGEPSWARNPSLLWRQLLRSGLPPALCKMPEEVTAPLCLSAAQLCTCWQRAPCPRETQHLCSFSRHRNGGSDVALWRRALGQVALLPCSS